MNARQVKWITAVLSLASLGYSVYKLVVTFVDASWLDQVQSWFTRLAGP